MTHTAIIDSSTQPVERNPHPIRYHEGMAYPGEDRDMDDDFTFDPSPPFVMPDFASMDSKTLTAFLKETIPLLASGNAEAILSLLPTTTPQVRFSHE